MTSENTMEICRNALAKGLEDKSLEVPVLSDVANQILTMANDPSTNVAEVSEIIHKDQALASYVLKVANSAYYGTGEQIVSLQQAVSRMGMKLLRDIALAIALQDDAFRTPGFEVMAKNLTRQALASAAYSKEIARTKRRNVEGQFLCGLLHSVGKPVVLKVIANWMEENKQELKKEEILQLIEEFHVPIGQAVTENWKLPQIIHVTSAYYNRYSEAPSFEDETKMTYLASKMGVWATTPKALSEEEIRKDAVIFDLNFYPEDVDALFEARNAVMSLVGDMVV